jgi:hypothetical protein
MHSHGTMTKLLRAIEHRLDVMLTRIQSSENTLAPNPSRMQLRPLPKQPTVTQATIQQELQGATNARSIWEFEFEPLRTNTWSLTIVLFAEKYPFYLTYDTRCRCFSLTRDSFWTPEDIAPTSGSTPQDITPTICWTLQDITHAMWTAINRFLPPADYDTHLRIGVAKGGFYGTNVTVEPKESARQWTVYVAIAGCGPYKQDLQYLPDTNQFQMHPFKAGTFHAAVDRIWEQAILAEVNQYGASDTDTSIETLKSGVCWRITIDLVDGDRSTYDLQPPARDTLFHVNTYTADTFKSAVICMWKDTNRRIQDKNEERQRADDIAWRRNQY